MRGGGARQVMRRSDRVGPSRSLGFGFYSERNMESFQGHLSREVIRSDSFESHSGCSSENVLQGSRDKAGGLVWGY